jgi:RNA polymerase sigma factor (sigma-70 family)
MTTDDHTNSAVRHLRRSVLLRDGAGLSDGQLLRAFVERRDGAAFEALVRRHGPLVWGVCRRLLGHHDAEDAFQAAFLVLARKAASVVPRELLPNWLYGVAHQTALKAKAMRAKRAAREKQVEELPEPAAAGQDHDAWAELQPVLDRELARLPDKYRSAVVLCDLEGLTHKEAAQQLGLPEGTVSSRLSRARALLAKKLARHGITLSAGSLAAALAEGAASAGVPTALVAATTKVAGVVAVRQAVIGAVVSSQVAALSEGVMKAMLLTKLRQVSIVSALLLVLGTAGTGVGLLTRTVLAAGQPGGAGGPQAQAAAPAKPPPPAQKLEKVTSIDKPIDGGLLKDLLDALSDKYELKIVVDEDAFRKAGNDHVSEKPIMLPSMPGVPLALVLELVTEQVGGTVKVNKDRFVIVPGRRDVVSVLGPAGERLKKLLAQDALLAFEKSYLSDLIGFFSDKYGLTVVVDVWAFSKADPATDLFNRRWTLPERTQPLQKWLEQIAKEINGEVIPRDNVVLIVPRKKAEPAGRPGLGSGAPAGQPPAEQQTGASSRVRELQKQRLAVLRELADIMKVRQRAGNVTAADVLTAERDVITAELELCATDKERVEVLERAVALEKQLEDLLAQQFRMGAGTVSPADILRVKAQRLRVEIDLEKAKARLAAPGK